MQFATNTMNACIASSSDGGHLSAVVFSMQPGRCSFIWCVEFMRMSTRKLAWLTLTLAVALTGENWAQAQSGSARLGTYEQGGRDYFALSLLPPLPSDPAQKNEVVILIDTSASQAGRYR